MKSYLRIAQLVTAITVVFGSPVSQTGLKDSLTSKGITASFPGDSSYASASSPFNLRFDFKPAAITFPTTPEQVSEVIQIGAAQNLTVSARSGGHSYIANGLGGANGALVIDLQNFKDITLDMSTGAAIIESGNRLGNVVTTLGNSGRALPHGTCAYVGIGGHASFGGFGFTSRMWGLTLDTITAVNTVLANGTIARVTADNYPNLFWGLRGSASSFGITTSIEVDTKAAPASVTIFQYDWNLNATAAAQAMAAFQAFADTDIPAYLDGEVNLGRGTSPGTVSFSLVGGWYAPKDGFESTIAPLLAQLPPHPSVSIQTGTYVNSAQILAGGPLDTSAPDGHDTFYAKSLMTPEDSPISNSALNAFFQYLGNEGYQSQTQWFVQFELYGGKNSAINAVPADATSFAHRSSTFTIQFYASSPNQQPPYPSYGFTFLDDMVQSLVSNSPQDWNYGAYTNYIDDQLVDWKRRYYGDHYDRLRSLKDQYDPTDVFKFPTAIEE